MKALTEKDVIGKTYGKLTVLGFASKRDKTGHKYFLCRCECGKEKVIAANHVRSGLSRSCGCGVVKATIQRNTTHGGTGTRLFNIWAGMRRRCLNPNYKAFKYYGGRGIRLAPEWDNFETFKEWSLKNGYEENLTIDRIDINGNYSPSNCRWVTLAEQARNKSDNRRITINGVTKLITEWCKEAPVSTTQVYYRLKHGWTIEEALFTPDKRKKHSNSITDRKEG